MPVVTLDAAQYERRELKSAPADPNVPGDEPGYIMVRPLPFGMKLERRDKATRMGMEVTSGRDASQQFNLETMNEWAVAFDFKYCIGEHNLTDPNGAVLDFGNPMTLKMLNPKVGSEIEAIINSMNEDESEESLEDFINRRSTSSPDDQNTLTTTTEET